MIPRYTRPEMAAVWTDERRLRLWWEVELAACEGMAAIGQIPAQALDDLRAAHPPSPDEVAEVERVTRHDVAAFVQVMERQVGEAAGRYIHLGLTSSDVLDTAFALQLEEAAGLLDDDLSALAAALRRRAEEHKYTPLIGRSHGIHAEPTTLGLVLAGWYAEVGRCRRRLAQAREAVRVGAISGAVGNFGSVDPRVEAYVCEKLGLLPEPVSTQIVQRDRHAELFAALALIASSVEKFAVQVRHWQRTEVLEAEEYFSPGQKGSSAMPHKRNPILSENVTGLCRLVRAYALPAMENVALWHERDISHSSVERVAAPDASIALDFLLRRFTGVIEGLVVYPERMRENLERTRGLIFSGRLLVALIRWGGLGREEAYRHVQRNAQRAFEEGRELAALVGADEAIGERLEAAVLERVFDLSESLGEVDFIFQRVFSEAEGAP